MGDIVAIAAGQKTYLALDKQHRVWRGDIKGSAEKWSFFEGKEVVEIGCGSKGLFCKTKDGAYYVGGIWPDRSKSTTEWTDPVLANELVAEKAGGNVSIVSCKMGYDMTTYTVREAEKLKM